MLAEELPFQRCRGLIVRREVRCGYAAHRHGAPRAPSRVERRAVQAVTRRPCGPTGVGRFQVRSDGSVFFAVRRMSAASCAKIHDEQAVMMPTHRNVAWKAGSEFAAVTLWISPVNVASKAPATVTPRLIDSIC